MITLDLPPPVSVNRSRRIDKAALPKVRAWTKAADALTTAAWAGGRRPKTALRRFEVTITLSKDLKMDLDNAAKGVTDYLKRVGLIVDDGWNNMLSMTVNRGDAPEGCRVALKSLD